MGGVHFKGQLQGTHLEFCQAWSLRNKAISLSLIFGNQSLDICWMISKIHLYSFCFYIGILFWIHGNVEGMYKALHTRQCFQTSRTTPRKESHTFMYCERNCTVVQLFLNSTHLTDETNHDFQLGRKIWFKALLIQQMTWIAYKWIKRFLCNVTVLQ